MKEKYTPEEENKLRASRTLSDARLLQSNEAGYAGEHLQLSEKQIEDAQYERLKDLVDKKIKLGEKIDDSYGMDNNWLEDKDTDIISMLNDYPQGKGAHLSRLTKECSEAASRGDADGALLKLEEIEYDLKENKYGIGAGPGSRSDNNFIYDTNEQYVVRALINAGRFAEAIKRAEDLDHDLGRHGKYIKVVYKKIAEKMGL